jgi:phosphate:Na+ symporter
MTIFNFITLAGGLGLFLFGMTFMGAGLERAASSKTESILQRLTDSPWKGAILGMLITAVIQSSSGTTVITIGLVNSGIMKFSQAVGVIMGSNVGTTVTGQIIRLSDISSSNMFLQIVKPSTLAPVAAIIGIVLYMFSKSDKKKNIGQILLGFGVLFTGMFTMEGAVMPLRESEAFKELFTSLSNPFLGILAGMIVTAIIQSSSASVGILQALTATGLVTWSSAVPIILGQNIGTCVTALLASIGAEKQAKRVAFAHLYFNIIGTAIFITAIFSIQHFIGLPFWENKMNMGDIANFHTIFNVATTMILLPLNKVLIWLAERTIKITEDDMHPELENVVLDERLYTSPSFAIQQAYVAVERMISLSQLLVQDSLKILFNRKEEAFKLAKQRENQLDKLDVQTTNYLVGITKLEINEQEGRDVTSLIANVTEFETIGDYAMNIAFRSNDIAEKGIVFSSLAKDELETLADAVVEIMHLTGEVISKDDYELAKKVEPLEQTIDSICRMLKDRHIERLKSADCNIDAGIVFLEVLSNYEKISDHCSAVVARFLESKSKMPDPHKLLRRLHKGEGQTYRKLSAHYKEKYKKPLT